MTYDLRGTDELIALSKRLKAAGNKGLQREFSKSITMALKPLKNELKQSARDTLPRSGGLGERVAKSSFRVSRRASGLRLNAKNAYQLQKIDEGNVRHPTFGNRNWVDQRVTPGWFTRPTTAAAPMVRKEIEDAMRVVAAKIEGTVQL